MFLTISRFVGCVYLYTSDVRFKGDMEGAYGMKIHQLMGRDSQGWRRPWWGVEVKTRGLTIPILGVRWLSLEISKLVK